MAQSRITNLSDTLRFYKLYVLVLIFCCLSANHLSAQERVRTDKKPNIVFIMADDLGYGDLSCYGSKFNRTPNIDLLAANGIKFTDFHPNGPMCSPTRASLLTGMYQHRFGEKFETALNDANPEDGKEISLGRVGAVTFDADGVGAMAKPFIYDQSNVEQFAAIF